MSWTTDLQTARQFASPACVDAYNKARCTRRRLNPPVCSPISTRRAPAKSILMRRDSHLEFRFCRRGDLDFEFYAHPLA
jgi:hypothetical protein